LSSIRLAAVGKTFAVPGGGTVQALQEITLEVSDGEVVVLLGPSGCGKTTLLRCVAGLEQPTRGEISIGDHTVFSAGQGVNLPPDRRDLGMVFQSYALWPHMTVADNVAYPLKRRGVRGPALDDRVAEVLELVDCLPLARRYPHEVSGGQQQRVALARALAGSPRVLLFDEPLSNLDAALRDRMRAELKIIQERVRFTAIYVTHDQREALALADQLVVMRHGAVLQTGRPEDVYGSPATANVARFLGAANVISVTRRLGPGSVETPVGELKVSPGGPDAPAAVVVRQESVHLVDGAGDACANLLHARVVTTEFLGDHRLLIAEAAGERLQARLPASARLKPGDACRLGFRAEAAHAVTE
jgi:iron(III) transport system ATP-binding protein